MRGRSVGVCQRKQTRAVDLPDTSHSITVQEFGKDVVWLFTAQRMVNASSEDFWPKPSMDEPLLVPCGLLRGLRHLAKEPNNILGSERKIAEFSLRSAIR